MADAEKVSIGFNGGQVVELKMTGDKLKELRKALEKAEGWLDLDTDDGNVSIDLAQVCFLRSASTPRSVGFGG